MTIRRESVGVFFFNKIEPTNVSLGKMNTFKIDSFTNL